MASNYNPSTPIKCVYCSEKFPRAIIAEHEEDCEDLNINAIQSDEDFDPTYDVGDNSPAHTNDYDS